eukprot:456729-Amphidinium_carterae.1
MRSLLRTQRISIGVLSELFGSKCATGQIDHDRPLARPEFVAMSEKICVKCFDDVMKPKGKQNPRLALPSSSHDDVVDQTHDHDIDDSLLKRDGEQVDLVVPGPETHVDDDAPMPLEDDLDDAQARKLRREAFTFEHSMAHRPKNPFCHVCISGKAVASKALVRAVSLSEQIGAHDPFVALQ